MNTLKGHFPPQQKRRPSGSHRTKVSCPGDSDCSRTTTGRGKSGLCGIQLGSSFRLNVDHYRVQIDQQVRELRDDAHSDDVFWALRAVRKAAIHAQGERRAAALAVARHVHNQSRAGASSSASSAPKFLSASALGRMHGRRSARGKVRSCHAILPNGVVYLTQIMPATSAGLHQRCRLGADPCAMHDNIIAGAACLTSSTTDVAFPGSSRPTTQVLRAGHITSHSAGRCRLRHMRTLHASLQVSGYAPDDAVPLASIDRSWTEASLFIARSGGSMIGARPAPKQQSPRPTTTVGSRI